MSVQSAEMFLDSMKSRIRVLDNSLFYTSDKSEQDIKDLKYEKRYIQEMIGDLSTRLLRLRVGSTKEKEVLAFYKEIRNLYYTRFPR